MADALRHSPLDAEHRALGARLVEFGGWEMPIQYSSVLAEHRRCREDAVVFDVSHLGTVRVQGSDAHDLLQWAFTNDLDRVAPGRAQYTHLLDPTDASVVDDIIVWWVAPDDLFVMPNASNTARVTDALGEGQARWPKTAFADVTATRAVLAIQGPRARERVATLDPAFAAVARFGVAPVVHDGVDMIVAGTGYTGEDGIEIHVPANDAPALWRAVLATGVAPAGLGARDTLRLEAGLPLHGHELGPGITPLQAGLGWVVRFDKGDFRGRAPLLAERDAGPARRLVGLTVDGRQPPRAGATVLRDGHPVGVVTSGNFSPTLEHGIALALVAADVPDTGDVELDLRARRVPAHLTKPPFVRKR